MARIRSIKPEYWDDRKLAKRTSRDARLLYIGLWNTADEHGRLNGDPQWIKGQLFAFDDDLDALAVDKLLQELADFERIVRYEVDDDPYIYLPKLAKHQRLDADKVRSRLPAPPGMEEPPPGGPRPPKLPFDHDRRDKSGPGVEKTRSDPDELAPDPDNPGLGAEKTRLLYVAGGREHEGREQGAGDAHARDDALLADKILSEHLGKLPNRPSKDVIRDLGNLIDRLLAEGTDPDVLREALDRWRAKPKRYGPALVPKLVADVEQDRKDAANGGRNGRASPRSYQPYRNPDPSAYDGELRSS